MGFSDETYAAAKKYTDKTVAGAGGLAGVPCQIQSITPITGGNRVTFLWIDNNGDEHTSTMNVMNGVDGEDGEDGKGIQSVSVNADNHLIITYTDGTSADAGQIEIHSAVDSVNGQTGAVVLDAEDIGALPDDTPIPSKTSDLTNDSGFITKVVNDLVNYYLKSETYSKTEVDDIVTAIKNSRFEVVATLPTTDIKTNVIYLVPKSPSQTSNVKDEYINLNGTSAGWEKIGDTEIDLSDYVTTQALNTALAAYTTTADLTTLLAAKQDTLTFDNAPTENSNNPVKSGGVYADEKSIYEVMGQMGAKNLLPNNAVSQTVNGVTFTVNSDGSVTANGTATAFTSLVIAQIGKWNYEDIVGKELILSGCPSGGASNTYKLRYNKVSGTYLDDIGNGLSFVAENEYVDTAYIEIAISGNTTVSNLTFYPMIRLASDPDSTYVPYAKTNRQLTNETDVLTDNILQNGSINIFDIFHAGVTVGNSEDKSKVVINAEDGTITFKAGTYANYAEVRLSPHLTNSPRGIEVNKKYTLMYKILSGTKPSNMSMRAEYSPADSWGNFVTLKYTQNTKMPFTSSPLPYYMIIAIRCIETAGGTLSNDITIKPLLVHTEQDNLVDNIIDYPSYAKSNRELTENVNTINNNGFLQANSYCFNCSANTSDIDAYGRSLGITSSTSFDQLIALVRNDNKYTASRIMITTNDANLTSSAPQFLQDLCTIFSITACAQLIFDVKIVDTYYSTSNERVEITVTDKNLSYMKVARMANGTTTIKTIALS